MLSYKTLKLFTQNEAFQVREPHDQNVQTEVEDIPVVNIENEKTLPAHEEEDFTPVIPAEPVLNTIPAQSVDAAPRNLNDQKPEVQ